MKKLNIDNKKLTDDIENFEIEYNILLNKFNLSQIKSNEMNTELSIENKKLLNEIEKNKIDQNKMLINIDE